MDYSPNEGNSFIAPLHVNNHGGCHGKMNDGFSGRSDTCQVLNLDGNFAVSDVGLLGTDGMMSMDNSKTFQFDGIFLDQRASSLCPTSETLSIITDGIDTGTDLSYCDSNNNIGIGSLNDVPTNYPEETEDEIVSKFLIELLESNQDYPQHRHNTSPSQPTINDVYDNIRDCALKFEQRQQQRTYLQPAHHPDIKGGKQRFNV